MLSFKLIGMATILIAAQAAAASAAPIESFAGKIAPRNDKKLECLVMENYDKVVKLDLKVEWPAKDTMIETEGEKRLTVWYGPPNGTEYVFRHGAFTKVGKHYEVKGYFNVRSGGTHQGITATAFEPVSDTATVANEQTVDVTKTRCRK